MNSNKSPWEVWANGVCSRQFVAPNLTGAKPSGMLICDARPASSSSSCDRSFMFWRGAGGVAFAPAIAQFRSSSVAAAAAEMEPPAKFPKLDDNGHINNGKVALASQALKVKKLSENAIVPSRGSALAAGYDLSSAYDDVVPARGKALVKTDLSIAIPEGTYARVAPRSGLAWKSSIDVGAGVIDADYRGPLGVILFNHADSDFVIKAGDRIAQLILELIVTPDVVEVDDLDATVRGEGGFGSTGISLVVNGSV